MGLQALGNIASSIQKCAVKICASVIYYRPVQKICIYVSECDKLEETSKQNSNIHDEHPNFKSFGRSLEQELHQYSPATYILFNYRTSENTSCTSNSDLFSCKELTICESIVRAKFLNACQTHGYHTPLTKGVQLSLSCVITNFLKFRKCIVTFVRVGKFPSPR